jgi:hypothetical protein
VVWCCVECVVKEVNFLVGFLPEEKFNEKMLRRGDDYDEERGFECKS